MNLTRGSVADDGGGGGGGDQGAHAVGDAFQVIVEAVAKMQVDMLRMNVKVGRTEEAAQLMMMGLKVHQKRVKRMEGRLGVVESKLPAGKRRGGYTEQSSEDTLASEGAPMESQDEAAKIAVSVQASISRSETDLMASMEPPQRKPPRDKLRCVQPNKPCARNVCGRARSQASPSPPSSPTSSRAFTAFPASSSGARAVRPRVATSSTAAAAAAAAPACGTWGARALAGSEAAAMAAVVASAADKRQEALGAALLKAAQMGSPSDVRALLRRGADVDFHNASRWTPLHMAARRARADVVTVLAQKGANVNARTSYGYTAVHMAAHHDFSGRCVHALAAAGANVNGRNKFGRTPLHLAAECGNELAVMRLLMAGANKSARNDEGKTPMDVAKTVAVRDLLNVE